MALPPFAPQEPDPSRARDEDAFDFARSQKRSELFTRLLESTSASTEGMGAKQRRHLAIAVGAISATYLAPILAAQDGELA